MDVTHSTPSPTHIGGPEPWKEHPMILDPHNWMPILIG